MTDDALRIAQTAAARIWRDAGLPEDALPRLQLHGQAEGFASSFAAVSAVQASVGLAALAATQVEQWRRPEVQAQSVSVDAQHAAFEASGYFTLNGVQPDPWAPISGLYACGAAIGHPGWVRIHANFDHHRDGALQLLGLPVGPQTERARVTEALQHWSAEHLEARAAEAGLPIAASRSSEAWRALGHAQVVASQALVALERIGDAPVLDLPQLTEAQRPLAGLKVLDLSRILAGPVAGRSLAAYGADVMLVNGPHLPNIDAIADTSRGKRSALIDLREAQGRSELQQLVRQSHVFLQAYRPGALEALGFGAQSLAQLRPGMVVAELSAYGWQGPWAGRRGFDSLVQTATGINEDEAQAAGLDQPQAMPMQALDFSAGFLLAFGAQAALLRQQQTGGSWRVRVSLAGVAHWLNSLGRLAPDSQQAQQRRPDIAPYLEQLSSGFGVLQAVRHSALFSRTPTRWDRDSVPPGTDVAQW